MKIARAFITWVGLGSLVLLAHPASAALTITVQPSAATAGGNGFFNVTLANPDTLSYQVATFNFELTVPTSSGITFTNADMNTALPYIFSDGSVDAQNSSPLSQDTFPTTDVTAFDSSGNTNGYVTVNPGSTFGLGKITYSLAPGTGLGPVTVSFTSSGTSLSDGSGNAIPFTTQNGAITVVSASPAPEPSEMGMMILMALILGGLLLRARRFRQH